MALFTTLLATIGPKLAQKGFEMLSGLFSSAAEKGVDLAGGVVKKQIDRVTQKIEEKTGIKLDDIADDKLTEEQWRQLKEFELQEQELILDARKHVAEIELEREKAHLADLQNARAAGISRDENEDPFVRRFTYWYAYLITGLTFLFIAFAIALPIVYYDMSDKKSIPDQTWQIINTVIGFLLGVGLSAIIQYFFGSSMGSKSKQRAMEIQHLIGGKKS
jgi:hypothetical protein